MAGLNNERRHVCDSCNITFSRRSSLVRHAQVRHSRASAGFKCSKCPTIISRRDLLQRHERLHQGEGLRECGRCSRTFRADYFPRHQRVCLRQSGKSPFQSSTDLRNTPLAFQAPDDSRFVGNLKWQDVSCSTSRQRRQPYDVSNSGEYATRRVKQPARFVTATMSSRSRSQGSEEEQEVWEPVAIGDQVSSAKTQSALEDVDTAELIEAILLDDEDLFDLEMERLLENLTLDEINDACTKRHDLPLMHLAAWQGSTKCLSWLIWNGGDADAPTRHGWTPIHCASYNGHFGAVMELFKPYNGLDGAFREFIDVGVTVARVPMVDDSTRSVTPLSLVVGILPFSGKRLLRGTNLLVGPDVEEWARSRLKLAEYVIQLGADVNGGNETRGPSPLQVACRNHDLPMAELLLNNGADKRGKPGAPTPLEEAKKHRSVALIDMVRDNSGIQLDDDDE